MEACADAWKNAVSANAGAASTHHRCPSSGGTGGGAWLNPAWQACGGGIVAAGQAQGWLTCPMPAAAPVPPVPCSALDAQTSASWDLLGWPRALARGADGALRWSIAEKSWAHGVRSDTWQGDDATDAAAHDKYVSGGRWGFFYYDGTAAGAPKPIAHATRFLGAYLRSAQAAAGDAWATPSRYALDIDTAPPPSSASGGGGGVPRRADGSSTAAAYSGYTFSGGGSTGIGGGGGGGGGGGSAGVAAVGSGEVLIVGGRAAHVSAALNFTVDRVGLAARHADVVPVALVMLRWGPVGAADAPSGSLLLMATNDVKATVDVAAFVGGGGGGGGAAEEAVPVVVGAAGAHGGLRQLARRGAASLQLLAGEVVTLSFSLAGGRRAPFSTTTGAAVAREA